MISRSDKEARDEIRRLQWKTSWSEQARSMAKFNVFPYRHSSDFPGDFDCQDFVFSELGLPHYMFDPDKNLNVLLKRNKVPELERVHEIPDRSVLAYYFGNIAEYVKLTGFFLPLLNPPENPFFVHYALCERYEGDLIVKSKWGEPGNVYIQENSIWSIPITFGNKVAIYRIKI